MSALRKIQLEETGYAVATGIEGVLPARPYIVATAPAAATESHLKQVALFAAAPFIGLAYAILLPFVGLGLLATLAFKAFAARYAGTRAYATARHIGMLVAAPFIGLAWIVALPFAGIAALAWVGTKALTAK